MFWELPKEELALDNLCKKCFFNECKAYKKIYLDLTKPASDNKVGKAGSDKTEALTPKSSDYKQVIELGFVEKLLESSGVLWRLWKRIIEAKAEISVKGNLSRCTYRTG